MTQINLTKKAVGDSPIRISDDGQHVTNGHWACRRDLLKQAALLVSVEAVQAMFPRAEVSTVTAESMDSVVPHFGNPVVYSKTSWVRTDGMGDTVLFAGKNGSQVWLNRRYVDLFGLEEVVSECADGKVGLSPVMVGERSEWQVIVMPQRYPYQEGLR